MVRSDRTLGRPPAFPTIIADALGALAASPVPPIAAVVPHWCRALQELRDCEGANGSHRLLKLHGLGHQFIGLVIEMALVLATGVWPFGTVRALTGSK